MHGIACLFQSFENMGFSRETESATPRRLLKTSLWIGGRWGVPASVPWKKSFWIGDERPLKSLESKPLFREQTLPWRPLKARLWIGDGRGPPWRPLKARLWIAGADAFESAPGADTPLASLKTSLWIGKGRPPPLRTLKASLWIGGGSFSVCFWSR